jgi:hypothetical protein
MTIRQLLNLLLFSPDVTLDTPISVTTDSDQTVGWTDFVIGAIETIDAPDIVVLECIPRDKD